MKSGNVTRAFSQRQTEKDQGRPRRYSAAVPLLKPIVFLLWELLISVFLFRSRRNETHRLLPFRPASVVASRTATGVVIARTRCAAFLRLPRRAKRHGFVRGVFVFGIAAALRVVLTVLAALPVLTPARRVLAIAAFRLRVLPALLLTRTRRAILSLRRGFFCICGRVCPPSFCGRRRRFCCRPCAGARPSRFCRSCCSPRFCGGRFCPFCCGAARGVRKRGPPRACPLRCAALPAKAAADRPPRGEYLQENTSACRPSDPAE